MPIGAPAPDLPGSGPAHPSSRCCAEPSADARLQFLGHLCTDTSGPAFEKFPQHRLGVFARERPHRSLRTRRQASNPSTPTRCCATARYSNRRSVPRAHRAVGPRRSEAPSHRPWQKRQSPTAGRAPLTARNRRPRVRDLSQASLRPSPPGYGESSASVPGEPIQARSRGWRSSIMIHHREPRRRPRSPRPRRSAIATHARGPLAYRGGPLPRARRSRKVSSAPTSRTTHPRRGSRSPPHGLRSDLAPCAVELAIANTPTLCADSFAWRQSRVFAYPSPS